MWETSLGMARPAQPKWRIGQGWPMRSAACGMLLRSEASGEPAGCRLSPLVFDTGAESLLTFTNIADVVGELIVVAQ